MTITHKIKNWGDLHHPKILGVIRMLLGLFLVLKGFSFLNNTAYLRYLIIENKAIRQSPEIISGLIYYVTYMHLVGGALIFLGLFTRLSAFLQLPIVFGAVFFVNILSPYVNAELWLSVLVLVLLVLFIVIGSGPLSLDHFLSNMRMDTDKDR
ncbi:MAG TPA: DoxX family protein [Puia sp.]|nr:DoxX family protein [Puia sp.]